MGPEEIAGIRNKIVKGSLAPFSNILWVLKLGAKKEGGEGNEFK
jgi:hypothetical protein